MAVPNTERGLDRSEGFTLIELCVVVLILGVLIAMASAVFLASQQRAKDIAAKELATHGLETQKVFLAEKLRYGTAGEVAPLEPALEFDTAPSTPAIPAGAIVHGKVYIRDANGDTVELVAKSESGKCFWMKDVKGDTTYAAGSCTAPPADAAYSDSW